MPQLPRPVALLCLTLALGCGKEAPRAFSLNFAATANGRAVTCTEGISGLGAKADTTVGISDLRMYISNLQMFDGAHRAVPVALDDNAFQLTTPQGKVAMIDLTGTAAGTCLPGGLASQEGTARTHLALTGTTRVDDVAAVSFDVGLPQPVMQGVIANDTEESAPSPLAEMYWDWNYGYRHFVWNFIVTDGSGAQGPGYVHLGSLECSPQDTRALSDRAACGLVNTPHANLGKFSLAHDTVAVDLGRVLDGVDFIAPVYDPNTFAVIGQGPGVGCHSLASDTACQTIFPRFGLNLSTGLADAGSDTVFYRQ